MKKVRVGIIGLGHVSRFHAKGYLTHERAEITAVCCQYANDAKKKADTWGAKKYYTDYHDLVRDKEIDAVAILTPHHLHAEMTLTAAKAGKHVAVEKPITIGIKEADEMIKAARDAKIKLMVTENQVFHPPHVKAKELIEAGEIGDPVMLRMKLGIATGPLPTEPEAFYQELQKWYASPPLYIDSPWRFDFKQSGGGRLLDCGHHRFAVARYLMGEFEEINAWIDAVKVRGIEIEFASMLMWKHKGVRRYGIMDEHYCSPKSLQSIGGAPFDDRIEITGTNGVIWINECEGRLVKGAPLILYKDGKTIHFENLKTGYEAGFIGLTHHFINCILEDKKPRFSGEDGKKVLQIILAAYKSAKEKKPIVPDSIYDFRAY